MDLSHQTAARHGRPCRTTSLGKVGSQLRSKGILAAKACRRPKLPAIARSEAVHAFDMSAARLSMCPAAEVIHDTRFAAVDADEDVEQENARPFRPHLTLARIRDDGRRIVHMAWAATRPAHYRFRAFFSCASGSVLITSSVSSQPRRAWSTPNRMLAKPLVECASVEIATLTFADFAAWT